MSDVRVDLDSFSKALVGILDDYGEDVASEVRKAVDVTAKELVSETKRTAPKRAIGGRPAGTFANHISSKIGRNTPNAYSKIWYVRSPEYRLTHLLAHGHALRQGGRWGGDPFLANAARTHSAKFEKRVKEAIGNAGR